VFLSVEAVSVFSQFFLFLIVRFLGPEKQRAETTCWTFVIGLSFKTIASM